MILGKLDIFKGLNPQELALMADKVVVRTYAKNTVVINEGDYADALYIINSGRVKVYCSDKAGKEFIMNTMKAGEHFGELALLDDDKRSASVRTLDKSNFCIIYKEDFNRVLDEQPNIAKVLIRNLARRVRKLTHDVKLLALQDVYGRVVNVLNDLAAPRDAISSIIPDKLTQQDIADRVGASREMVARILKDLVAGDYISFEGRQIIIHGRLPAEY
ncbi:Crp/Fnr family transcriptional regulator [Dasania sp. GY-MA-18]|uniref:Crp/Fnr family transcriptional regulator n=1 Tax=Dasania phycosphaerae TaxID=2950436 RepID=A0A9J6RKE4_9GAMM|nr:MULTISPECIES: Crp/Fnr family transcriptional regulator [Dasania]MCR8922744.1 Crp/Fnr family transcriptional regulator [Dasania sp. GY-MA-18]MCZ0865174.1 Crp/Fnr family transcriptional regulator [Dasania phycosphaerae]MCZ0868900.1 Crp/Fnr family transcriptional regulator [Dasania phycosphaerae]